MTEVAAGPPEAAQLPSPYPGLKPFSEEQSEFFFGRESDAEIIVANLRARRLTVLYGPSGVGKSSVLRAGVAASLRRRAAAAQAKRGRAPFVPVVVDNWKDDPVQSIVAAVKRSVQDLLGDESAGPASTGDLADDLNAWAEHLGGELLLILDQFEEFYEYHREPGGTLDEQLPKVVSREGLPASLLISIREDALALLDDRFKRSVPGLLDSRLRVGHLDREKARDAIVKPIEHYNEEHKTSIEIEPALVDEVLDQVTSGRVLLEQTGAGAVDGGDPSSATVETPYLQLVLSRLWQEEQRAGSSVLRLETLRELGGAETIVRTHLDEALESFPEEEQDVAADLFKYLVTPSGTKIALRPADLASYTEHPEERIQPVLLKLAERSTGILRSVAPPPGVQTGPRYEIYHDVLAGAILDWRSRHSQAELRRQKEEAEKEARAAQEREDKERRRARLLRAWLIGSLVLLGTTVVGFVFALQQRSAAIAQTERAQSVLIADRAAAEPSQEVAVLMGVEAYRLAETLEARSAVLTTLQANTGMPKLLDGHPRSVNDIAFSPDSRLLASGASDAAVRLWDVAEGAAVGDPLRTGLYVVSSVAIGGEGGLLAAAGDKDSVAPAGGPVALWDIGDPLKPRRLSAIRGDMALVAFSGNSPLLAGAGRGAGTINLWDLGDPGSPRRLPPIPTSPLGEVRALAFSRSGRMLAAGDELGQVVLWRVAANGRARRLSVVDHPSDRFVTTYSLAFSGDGSRLAWSGDAGAAGVDTIVVWDVSAPTRPRLIARPAGHVGVAYSVDFGSDSSRLVSAGTDGQVLVWDGGLWQPFGPPRAHDFAVDILGVVVSPDGATVASADNGGAIKLWPVREPGALSQTVGAPGGLIWDLAVTSNDVVAAASGLEGIELWSKSGVSENEAPKRVGLIPREEKGTSYEVLAHDTRIIGATGYSFGVWDLESGKPELLARSDAAKHPTQWISALAVTSDGNTVASADFSGNVVLWDIADREEARFLATIDHGERPVDALAFSASGDVLASGDRGGAVRLWDVSNSTAPQPVGERFVAHQSDPVWALAFSPADDGFLVSGGGDRRVALWNVGDPTRVQPAGRPLLHSNSVLGLTFDSEGARLAVADGDAGVVIYDVESRHPLGLGIVGYAGTNATFEAVAFDAEEETLYSAGQRNPVVAWDSALWSGDFDTLRENACRLARRDLTEEEWAEVFVETKLESGYRRTCTE